MRVLQISSARALGGGETHFIDLVNGLHQRGHEVHVALTHSSPLLPLLEKIPERNILSLPLRNSLDAPSARRLARIVRDRQIEIVHAHMARDYPLAAYAVRRNKATQLVLTRHVLFPISSLHAITLAGVSRVIAVSAAVADALIERRVCSPEKISVVRNGIDSERFANARVSFDLGEFCRRINIPEGRLLVGTVGEITTLKGHEDFVRAAALISAQFPTAHFIIAGEDHSRSQKYEAALAQLISEVGLEDRVQRFGRLENLAELYCALDVFVSASQSEAFGLAIVESMAAGTPVVATATAGANETIVDGVSGTLVPVGDVFALAEAVNALLADANERHRKGENASRRARDYFNRDRMVAETEAVYREVLGGKR